MKRASLFRVAFLLLAFTLAWLTHRNSALAAPPPGASPYQRWTRGPSSDPTFFPLAVWLQSPAKAEQYAKAGINTYVALWRGPTEEQLAALKSASLKVICHQNEVGLRHQDDPAIIGWMHGDEPDNAQSQGRGQGYGSPILPEKIIRDYEAKRAADPSRPILLNLGQGVAWDNYIGRGVRRNHPEDYPEYVKGADIVSFDIYPVVHEKPEVAGKLWYVAHGVERLVKWSGPEHIVWNCLECTRISNLQMKATPHQVRGEAWMSIIHGSRGLIYFVHEWQPKFNESAILSDLEVLEAVTALNRQITSLAPVINSPAVPESARVQSENSEAPIALLTKRHNNAIYLFAVGMREAKTSATFTIPNLSGKRTVTVLDENRTLTSQDGVFRDAFEPWDVHLYRVAADAGR